MSIRDVLIPLLVQKFGVSSFVEDKSPEPLATFAAAHSDVGDVKVWEDGPEVIVEIGSLTHGHFASYAAGSKEDIEQEVAESVTEFLSDLFAENYVLFRSPHGNGWAGLNSIAGLPEGFVLYTWAGPYD